MASIEQRGGKYRVRWWTQERRQRTRTCPNISCARDLKTQVEELRALGRDWEPQGAGAEPDLVDVARQFIEHRSLRLRPRTLLRYAENLDLFVRFLRRRPEGTGRLPVALLGRPLLDDYYRWLCRAENGLHGRGRGRDTARKIVEVAQLLWEWADQSDRWPGRIPHPRRIEMVRSAPMPVIAPTWAEMDACVAAARSWHRHLATFLRYTGLRIGEAMLLEQRDYNERHGTLTIRREVNKTGTGRVIPISPHLVAEIATWERGDGVFLIPSGGGLGDRYRQGRSCDLAQAWRRAGARNEGWSHGPSHAFRRGWKSGLLALGAQPDAVDYLQGHALGRGEARERYIDPCKHCRWCRPLRWSLGSMKHGWRRALLPQSAAHTEPAQWNGR